MYTTEECFACHEKKREIMDRLGKFLAFPTCPQTTSFYKLCSLGDAEGVCNSLTITNITENKI
jgi:hypothetical protein